MLELEGPALFELVVALNPEGLAVAGLVAVSGLVAPLVEGIGQLLDLLCSFAKDFIFLRENSCPLEPKREFPNPLSH